MPAEATSQEGRLASVSGSDMAPPAFVFTARCCLFSYLLVNIVHEHVITVRATFASATGQQSLALPHWLGSTATGHLPGQRTVPLRHRGFI